MTLLRTFTTRPSLQVLFLLSAGVLCYSNTLDVPLQWDDAATVIQTDLLDRLRQAPSFSDFYFRVKGRVVGYLTFALNYRLHGLEVRGFHLFNTGVHLANGILLYILVCLTFRTPAMVPSSLPENRQKLLALFAGLLFLVHPVQTQAVTYIMQRLASLAAMFYIASLSAYVSARLAKKRMVIIAWYAVSMLSALLAMETKQNTITLPLTVMLYEFAFFSGPFRKRVLFLFPIFLTLPLIPLVTLWSPQAGRIAGSLDAGTRLQTDLPRLDFLFTEIRVVATYLRLLLLPVNQSIDYDYPLSSSLSDIGVLPSLILHLMLAGSAAGLLIRSRIREDDRHAGLVRLAAFGILWFYLTLSIESGLIPIADVIFEHRVYLPSAGFVLFAVAGIFLLAEKAGSRPSVQWGITLLCTAVIVSFASATYVRNSVWRSDVSLWEDTARKSPYKARVWSSLSKAYLSTDETEKGLAAATHAIRIDPLHSWAWNNLGTAYLRLGDYVRAEEAYQQATVLDMGLQAAWKNLALVQV